MHLGVSHMYVAYCILSYLKSAPSWGLLFSNHDHLSVESYTDANWAGSSRDRQSTSRCFTFVGGKLVTWRSKKHAVVAKSSAKAEFCTMTHDICKLKCVKMMLNELGFNTQESMRLYINNKATINIAHAILYNMIVLNMLKLTGISLRGS